MEEEEEETEVEDEREDWEKGFPVENSLLCTSSSKDRFSKGPSENISLTKNNAWLCQYCSSQEEYEYLWHLHYFILSYAVVLIINFAIVFCCMAVVYSKVFHLIKKMILTQGNSIFIYILTRIWCCTMTSQRIMRTLLSMEPLMPWFLLDRKMQKKESLSLFLHFLCSWTYKCVIFYKWNFNIIHGIFISQFVYLE